MTRLSEGSDRNRPKRGAAPPASLDARGFRVAIVAARFNDHVVVRLMNGAMDALRGAGVSDGDVDVIRVPGAFELPVAASALAGSGGYDAIIALACVVRGETHHFEHVARAAADGLERVSLDHLVPVGFGVLTTDTIEQAIARAGGAGGNRGADAAVAALEMVSLLRRARSG